MIISAVPLGVRRLQTFCRNGVSTKAGGGPLIPTVLSLLSTSNIITSNKCPPAISINTIHKYCHHPSFVFIFCARFIKPSFSRALMRSRPSPIVTVKRSSGRNPNHSVATSRTVGSSSTASTVTLGTKSRRNWASAPPPSPTSSTDTGLSERSMIKMQGQSSP